MFEICVPRSWSHVACQKVKSRRLFPPWSRDCVETKRNGVLDAHHDCPRFTRNLTTFQRSFGIELTSMTRSLLWYGQLASKPKRSLARCARQTIAGATTPDF